MNIRLPNIQGLTRVHGIDELVVVGEGTFIDSLSGIGGSRIDSTLEELSL